MDGQVAAFDPVNMKKLLATALLAAACGSAPHATTPTNQGGKSRAISAPPTIKWNAAEADEGAFEVVGFPAIASDGSRVLIADEVQGAGMTPPNLTLRQIDRNDHEADKLEVMPYDASADP